MKKYYSCYPICPNCLNPVSTDKYLVKFNDKSVFKCTSCNNKFRNLVNISCNGNIVLQFPLFTEININIIESAYIDWILNSDFSGKYLITWPWDTVKFIPILLSEYFQKFNEDKVIIFFNKKFFNSSKIIDLDYRFSLNSLFYFNEEISFKSDFKSLSISDIFLKINQGYCKIFVDSLDINNIYKFNKIIISNFSSKNLSPISFNLGDYNEMEFNCGFVDDEKNCFKKFLDKFNFFFGETSVKSIDYGNEIKHVNDNGIFELKFFSRNEFDKTLKISDMVQNTFFKIYNNKFKLTSSFFNIPVDFIYNEDDLKSFNDLNSKSMLFIDEELFSKSILDLITEFDPNLIIADIDGLFGYNRFASGHPIWKLFNVNCNMLFFSTDLNRRNTYDLYGKGRYIHEKGLVYHTWDHPEIYNKLFIRDKKYFSLFSSNFNNIHGETNPLNIKFNECDELEDIDECFKIFKELLNNGEVNRFIKNLIKTPIYIEGNFKAPHRKLSWQYLLSIIYNLDRDKWIFLKNSFEKVYGWNNVPKNPLLDNILVLLDNNGWNENELAIIVNHHDINRFKKLLEEKIGENNILITKWKDLNENIKNSSIKYAIATEFPILDYNLYSSPLNEVIIVASPMTVKTFKMYYNNRLTQKNIKPLYILKNYEKGPQLLKELFSEIDVNDIEEFNITVNKNVDSHISKRESENKNFNKIKKGTSVILVSNKENKYMILPFDKTISVLTDKIDILEISKGDDCSLLLNTNIIINNPLKKTFLKFVLENDDNYKINEKQYMWLTFKDLVKSMFEWVNMLHNIVEKEYALSQKTRNDVKKDIVSEIKEYGVNVKTDYYIKKSWLSEPIGEFQISNDEIILFFDVERTSDPENTVKIYQWVLKEFEEFSVPSIEAYKSHAAAKKFQNLRKHFFHNDVQNIPKNLRQLNNKFQSFIKDEFEDSDLFKVDTIKFGKIKKDVKPYVIMDSFHDFFEESR